MERNAKAEMDSLKQTIEILKNMHELNSKNPVLAQYEKGYLDALSNIEMAIAAIETQKMITESINQFWNLFKFTGFNEEK
ncbi:MAG: hypothetical protein PHC92_05425 [Syntrophomonadaceae bacterium]|nr:hypothetical protein [Syntrophomonadaceae bacterium]MDD3022980.1 hypothetical protein [Syntrophomonadaceae bacterium]